jgi:1,4-dihydroxy-2-naphthoate octaprenyltransferase
VLHAGIFLFALAAITGTFLAVTISWWLLALTAFCALGGWFYTGGPRPYGYQGLGEVSIFLFHGVIAVCATAFIQLGRVPPLALGAAVPVGLLACALLVTNNLRDIPTDAAAGKITLAVVMGERRTRRLYVSFVALAFVTGLALSVARPWVLLLIAAVPFAAIPVRRVLGGVCGAGLIAVLEHTCLLLLVYGALLTIGLAQ